MPGWNCILCQDSSQKTLFDISKTDIPNHLNKTKPRSPVLDSLNTSIDLGDGIHRERESDHRLLDPVIHMPQVGEIYTFML